jgi:hypothetical protein
MANSVKQRHNQNKDKVSLHNVQNEVGAKNQAFFFSTTAPYSVLCSLAICHNQVGDHAATTVSTPSPQRLCSIQTSFPRPEAAGPAHQQAHQQVQRPQEPGLSRPRT